MNKTLTGSSLIETIVALVVLAISTGFAAIMFMRLMEHEQGILKLQAQTMIEIQRVKVLQQGIAFDEVVDRKSIKLYQSLTPYQDMEKMNVLHLKATDAEGNLLAETKEIVLMP